MEQNPRQRYSSARDLADDLRRFLRGEPTLVRPLAPTERLVRWTRRKPILAALIAVSSLSLLTLIGVLSWSNVRLSKAYQQVVEKEAAARASALEARKRAYASDMRLIDDTWTKINNRQANDILDPYRPKPGEPDLRGFEWWLYWKLINTDTPSRVVGRHEGGVLYARLSPTGDMCATGGADGNVFLWNAREGRLIRELAGHDGNVNCLAFSPDGKRLASAGDDKTVRIWDIATGTTTRIFSGHTDWVAAVLFLPDGETVASGGADAAVVIWNANTAEERGRLLGHGITVRSLAYHLPTKTLFSASEDTTIRAWDVENMTPSGRLEVRGLINPTNRETGPTLWFRRIEVEPDQASLVGISFGRTIVKWLLRPPIFGKVYEVEEFDAMVRSESLGGPPMNPLLVLGMDDGLIRVSNGSRFQSERRFLRGHRSSVEAVVVSPDERVLLSGAADGEVRHWSLDHGRNTLRHLRRDLRWKPALSADGKYIAAFALDEHIEVIRFEDLQTIHRFPAKDVVAEHLWFSRDAANLAFITGGRTLHLLSMNGETWELDLGSDIGMNDAAFSKAGDYLAVAGKNAVVLVNTTSRTVAHRLPHLDRANDVAFRGAEELISACSDGAIRIWNRSSGTLLRTLPLNAGDLHEISLDADERLLAVRCARRVVVLNLENGKVIASLPHRVDRGSVHFLAGGRTLLTWNEEGSNQLWNAETWQ
ncbi:MAG: WD40 repeat domain-containing protein, partial [Planctomycetota bacterium]